jgi:hypothetical protein
MRRFLPMMEERMYEEVWEELGRGGEGRCVVGDIQYLVSDHAVRRARNGGVVRRVKWSGIG